MDEFKELTRAAGRLPELGALRIAGADVRNFLQGQLSNDLRQLSPTRSLFAAQSTPQGRVIALHRLVQRSDGLIAILPAALIGTAIERLRRYVLRAKVVLSDASAEFTVAGSLAGDLPPGDARSDHHEIDGVSVVRFAGKEPLSLLVAPAGKADALFTATRFDANGWRLAGIRAGLPQIHPATSELFVAQMLNLDLIDGVSFSKGCYTGQEIIARTQHLGRIKRRMLRFETRSATSIECGAKLELSDGRSARVVESARREHGIAEFLAVTTLGTTEREGGEPAAQSLEAVQLPLPYPIPD